MGKTEVKITVSRLWLVNDCGVAVSASAKPAWYVLGRDKEVGDPTHRRRASDLPDAISNCNRTTRMPIQGV